jgi:hypothetical protein
MASLKSLTLTALPQIQADPVMDRRNRTIGHLEGAKTIATGPERDQLLQPDILVLRIHRRHR